MSVDGLVFTRQGCLWTYHISSSVPTSLTAVRPRARVPSNDMIIFDHLGGPLSASSQKQCVLLVLFSIADRTWQGANNAARGVKRLVHNR